MEGKETNKKFFELLDKIEQEEREKIQAELEQATLEDLQELRKKAKVNFNNYSPSQEGHDRKTAFINYTKYQTDWEEIDKATIKKTFEAVTEETEKAKTIFTNILDKLDFLGNEKLFYTAETIKETKRAERLARYIYNIIQQIKELEEE